MIIDKNKIIFFHPGKTGGSSIEKIFFNDVNNNNFNQKFFFGFRDGIYTQHSTLNYLKKIDPNRFNNYTKIISIRNPYDRIYSVYKFGKKCKLYKSKTFEEFIIKEIPNFFNDKMDIILKGHHITPQSYYFKINNKKYIDHIIKFENFEDDVIKLMKTLKIEINEVPHEKITKKDYDLSKLYSNEMIETIKKYYFEDFENFNY